MFQHVILHALYDSVPDSVPCWQVYVLLGCKKVPTHEIV